MLKEYNNEQNNQNSNEEQEVALGTGDDGFLDYPMVAQNSDIHDIEMGNEEQKKEKSKTPSTGKLYYIIILWFIKLINMNFFLSGTDRSLHTG